MRNSAISGTDRWRMKRDKKIITLYHKLVGEYKLKLELYYNIASKCGCGYNTVITVLQKNGIIEPKQNRNVRSNDTY